MKKSSKKVSKPTKASKSATVATEKNQGKKSQDSRVDPTTDGGKKVKSLPPTVPVSWLYSSNGIHHYQSQCCDPNDLHYGIITSSSPINIPADPCSAAPPGGIDSQFVPLGNLPLRESAMFLADQNVGQAVAGANPALNFDRAAGYHVTVELDEFHIAHGSEDLELNAQKFRLVRVENTRYRQVLFFADYARRLPAEKTAFPAIASGVKRGIKEVGGRLDAGSLYLLHALTIGRKTFSNVHVILQA